MLYKGDFRSLDQSVDKKGQKYRVLIFTGYDPSDSGRDHTGPYPWNRRQTNIPIPGQPDHFIYYPNQGVELTMTDNPFIVNYTGDQKNIYKPYRCSSASVSFLQSSLNQDFINALGQGVLVMLLKWKNDVYESGSSMVNSKGGSITKHRYYYTDEESQRVVTVYNDYDPWEYDKFCYDVEWIGFSTPTMLNVEYDHVVDAFTLECQDALSTLQYTEFVRTDQMEDMLVTLFRMLATLGTYRDIYLTTSVHIPAALDDIEAATPTTGNALRWIAHQQDNFIKEDGEPLKYMDILEDMMEYLGLTAIPYQDRLYIVNSVALGNGHNDYNHYQFQSGNDILPWILPVEMTSETPTTMYDVNIVDTIHLTKESFCGGTQLSSDSMYNKVKVVCDEMRPDPLLPDLVDTNNFIEESVSMGQPLVEYTYNGNESNPTDIYLFEGYFNRPAIEDIKFYRYPAGDPGFISTYPNWVSQNVNWFYDPEEVVDADLNVTNESGDNLLDGVTKLGTYSGQNWIYAANMAVSSDFSVEQAESLTDIPSSFSLSRKILLITYMNYNQQRKVTQSGTWCGTYDLDDKSTYWNPMLYIKSKPFLGNGKQYLNIVGNFGYYVNTYSRYDGWLPTPTKQYSSYYKFDKDHNYVWAMVKLGEYYLADNGRGNYSWVLNESKVRLWCDNGGTEQDADYRGINFYTETNVRGVEGISVKLPINEGNAEPYKLEIWIDRPIGPGSDESWMPECTVIDGLDINIYSSEYVETRKRRNPDRDNTEYHNEIISGAVEEYPEVGLIHSSCDTAGLSYSETARHTIRRRTLDEDVWKTNPKVISDGDGYYGLPEEVGVRGMKHQLETPTVIIQTALFNILTPLSRVLWRQMSDKKFVVDSISINYEYEQCDVDLIEVKDPSTVVEYGGIYRVNITRNYHRTRDLMFDGHVARRSEIEISLAPVIVSNNVDVDDHEVLLTTPNEALGGGNLNVDWDSGLFRLTAPAEGNMSAYNNNGEVFISV